MIASRFFALFATLFFATFFTAYSAPVTDTINGVQSAQLTLTPEQEAAIQQLLDSLGPGPMLLPVKRDEASDTIDTIGSIWEVVSMVGELVVRDGGVAKRDINDVIEGTLDVLQFLGQLAKVAELKREEEFEKRSSGSDTATDIAIETLEILGEFLKRDDGVAKRDDDFNARLNEMLQTGLFDKRDSTAEDIVKAVFGAIAEIFTK